MKNKILLILLGLTVNAATSCKKFIAIDPPRNSVLVSNAFEDNSMATAAVLGIYEQMVSNGGYASGGSNSIAIACATSSDELVGYSDAYKRLFEHQLAPAESPVTQFLWTQLYARIFDANAILDGLDKAVKITPSVKTQLQGEVLFLRAFHYFYLINLFGAVPLHLTTDYQNNTRVFKTPENEVYRQIIDDLKKAELLLGDPYPTIERVRPNKATVRALLARVFLYTGDWVNAEKYATSIIEKETEYKLVELNSVFLKTSVETIWQLMPRTSENTAAGATLILSTVPVNVSLSPAFAEQAFEANDERKTSWVKSVLANNVTYYYPFKYKVANSTNVSEYYMVFRLAEQLLIRSEARAQQNNLPDAIDDLDLIRGRASLPLLKNTNPSISKEDLLVAIQNERRIELFSEWGDRWLDLKRTNTIDAVLASVKSNWKIEYALYPIPKGETDHNPNIIQNPGY